MARNEEKGKQKPEERRLYLASVATWLKPISGALRLSARLPSRWPRFRTRASASTAFMISMTRSISFSMSASTGNIIDVPNPSGCGPGYRYVLRCC
ncbi:hypothetical protein Cni_G26848 [Canna indica]|uniref:Uncharacterized protein n=1 Tax=Canna indica TaxID=4628 RepID=A0AAQ3L0F9_9LILI|nr:hypothetical protein Cni_G26848 [Canna indica]